MSPRPLHGDRRIFETRWREWEPILGIELRINRVQPYEPALEEVKQRHRQILTGLLRIVPVRTIRRSGFDDPRISEDERAERVQIYLERKAARAIRLFGSKDYVQF